jgi:hypothetical protein
MAEKERREALQTIISNAVALQSRAGGEKHVRVLKRAEKTRNEKIPKMYKTFAAEHVLSAARGNY